MKKINGTKSKSQIIDKTINSGNTGNRTTVNNNNSTNYKFFRGINMFLDNSKFNKKIINANNVLVNSFIKFQRKTATKK